MLTKLLKYEIKYTARNMLPTYLGIIIIAVLSMFFNNDHGFNGMLSAAYSIVLVAFITASIGLTGIIVIQRFHKNLYSNEGYLTLTLPVTSRQHILSKLLNAMLWCFLTGAILVVTSLVIGSNLSGIDIFAELSEGFSGFFKYVSIFEILQVILEIISSLALAILIVYISISIAQSFTKSTVVFGVISFFAINWAISFIKYKVYELTFSAAASMHETGTTISALTGIITNVEILLNIVLCGLFFYAITYLLDKKINI